MKKLKQILYQEFVADSDLLYWLFMVLGVGTQVVAFLVAPADYAPGLSLACGICGIFSVLLCSRMKISSFFFGYLQVVAYMILAYQQRFYGELAINIFYFVTMVYGCISWKRSYESGSVIPRKVPASVQIVIAAVTLVGIAIGYLVLLRTNDTQPFMDSLTTIPAFTAQILMVTRCRQQWYYWIVVDASAMLMWGIAGDWCMAAQYLFWTANCVYGLAQWGKLKTEN